MIGQTISHAEIDDQLGALVSVLLGTLQDNSRRDAVPILAGNQETTQSTCSLRCEPYF